MTKIKFCGLQRPCDIEAANRLKPEFIGFVFAENRRRYVSPEKAVELKKLLSADIKAVGVFLNNDIKTIARLAADGVIDMIQLHGDEDENFLSRLREFTDKPIIKAFTINAETDIDLINLSSADFVLTDSGAGTGKTFDRSLINGINRPFFLAGGLNAENVGEAIDELHPYAVDLSTGIETDGFKDKDKMAAVAAAVRKDRIL